MRHLGPYVARTALTALLSAMLLSAIGSSLASDAAAQAPKKTSPPQPKEAVVLPDGPGKETAERVCSKCHGADVWAKQRHTSEQWNAIVDRMISRGAEGTDDEFAEIEQYLATSLAPASSVPPPAAPSAAQPAAAPKPKTADVVVLPDGPGKDVAERICSTCHGVDVWAKQRHTPAQWGAIVDRMVSKGAEGTDDEFAAIMQYLSTNLTPTSPAPAPKP